MTPFSNWHNEALDASEPIDWREIESIEAQEQLHESEFGIWKQGDE